MDNVMVKMMITDMSSLTSVLTMCWLVCRWVVIGQILLCSAVIGWHGDLAPLLWCLHCKQSVSLPSLCHWSHRMTRRRRRMLQEPGITKLLYLRPINIWIRSTWKKQQEKRAYSRDLNSRSYSSGVRLSECWVSDVLMTSSWVMIVPLLGDIIGLNASARAPIR